MTFLTIVRVTEICSFRLVLERKTGKEIPESSRSEFLANNFALSDAEDINSGPLNGRGITFTFVKNAISNSPKVPRAKSLGSDGLLFY